MRIGIIEASVHFNIIDVYNQRYIYYDHVHDMAVILFVL